ncbi:MAG: desulfoferrodoxin [Bacteroidales bacterium]|nr:desulfoferrodoxin [Bacteroidales bacterium]
MATKFYLCKSCGNLIVKVLDSGVTPVCCGSDMMELIPGVSDGAGEKHIPVVERIDDSTIKVKVGAVPHPMVPAHHITFIYLETENGGQLKKLDPEGTPEAVFNCSEDKPVAVYEYCNLHGLWKTEL